PASSVAYECLAVGMYLLVGYYSENQKFIHEGIKGLSEVFHLDYINIESFKSQCIQRISSIIVNSFLKSVSKKSIGEKLFYVIYENTNIS
ncbi:MAG: hypothetical protein NZ516_11820, partial [Raineya sp.]|nr:hypothetical protein [Raineya sp.]